MQQTVEPKVKSLGKNEDGEFEVNIIHDTVVIVKSEDNNGEI